VSDGGDGFDLVVIAEVSGLNLSIGTWTSVEQVNGLTGADTIDATGMATGIVIAVGDGNDVITGGSGNDTVYADGDDDLVNGGAGQGILIGGAGADTINGGADNDYMDGGAGADEFQFDAGWGVDTVANFEDGTDMIDFSGHAGVNDLSDLTINSVGTTTTITLAGGTDQIILTKFNGTLTETDFNFI